MKNNLFLLSLLMALLIIVSCGKEEIDFQNTDPNFEIKQDYLNENASKRPSNKVLVCHKTNSESNPWKIIKVSKKAVKAHLAHGDAVDMDGDGYFHMENGCNVVWDADDDDPEGECIVVCYIDADDDGLAGTPVILVGPCDLVLDDCITTNEDCDDDCPDIPLNYPCPDDNVNGDDLEPCEELEFN